MITIVCIAYSAALLLLSVWLSLQPVSSTASTSFGSEIKRFTVFGERNSGTNFLESLISKNFNLSITWNYGYKHFFGWNDYHRNESAYWASQVRIPVGFHYHRLSNSSDDVLFFGIVRSPLQWLGSMHSKPWHLPHGNRKSWHAFLTKEFYSIYDMQEDYWQGKEILSDHHIYLNRRYINIFESRATKCSYFLDDIPHKVKHFMLIKYEDLIHPSAAKVIFNTIANKIWHTDYPNIEKNDYILALSQDLGSSHSHGSHSPKTKIYSLPPDVLAIVERNLNKSVEIKLGYEV